MNLSNSAALQCSTVVVPAIGGLVFSQGVTGGAFVLGDLSGSGNLALQNNAGTPAAYRFDRGRKQQQHGLRGQC